jgi:hypothetical protein
MNSGETGDVRVYDRAFLLSAEKRNQIMALWEVRQYGLDSYGDADYVSIYGMRPADWYGRGVRLLARTVVECTRDALADRIGRDVAQTVNPAFPAAQCFVLDPFAGSCNTLYWILSQLPGARGVAFEDDARIYELTRQNIVALDTPIELRNGDYLSLAPTVRVPADCLLIIFVAPPWGDALNTVTGLDLRRTSPPIGEIVEYFDQVYADQPILYVAQVYERLEPVSLAELEARFDWSDLRIYDINAAGANHGVLLGGRRWKHSAGV